MWEKTRQREDEEADGEEKEFKPQKTFPISIENEKKTLETIRTICQKSLDAYKTTLDVKRENYDDRIVFRKT